MKRDSIFDWISLNGLRNLYSTLIGVSNKLRYTSSLTFDNDRDIPDVGYVKAQAGLSLNKQQYSELDLVDDGGGGFYLPYVLSDGEIGLGIRIDYETFSEQLPFSYDFVNQAITGFTSDNDQTIYVFASGVYSPPAPLPDPTITVQPPSIASIYEGRTLTITIAGTDITGFQWNKDGIALTGQTSATLTISNFKTSDNGVYTCFVYNSSGNATTTGCTASQIAPSASQILMVNNSPSDTIYQNDFGASNPLSANSVVSISPMSSGQGFYIEIPVGCTLEYQRYNSDGSKDGTVLVIPNTQIYATSFSLSGMDNSKGHQFLIRTT